MCEHGRILHHLYHHGANERNAILFVGYRGRAHARAAHPRGPQGQGAGDPRPRPADDLPRPGVQDERPLRHADAPGLEAFIRAHARSLKNAFLVHGEPDAAESLATWVRDTTAARTLVPGLGQEAAI
jgi:metallo-beta-lactamase family protein